MNWQQRKNEIELHYANKAQNFFLSPVWLQRVAEAYANSGESNLVAFHKNFWSAQPEYQNIFEGMHRELQAIENEYCEHHEFWNPPLRRNPNVFWRRYTN